MKVIGITEDAWSRVVAEDLLWHAENAENPKTGEALLRAAFYYMTFDQVTSYVGCPEIAKEMFFND